MASPLLIDTPHCLMRHHCHTGNSTCPNWTQQRYCSANLLECFYFHELYHLVTQASSMKSILAAPPHPTPTTLPPLLESAMCCPSHIVLSNLPSLQDRHLSSGLITPSRITAIALYDSGWPLMLYSVPCCRKDGAKMWISSCQFYAENSSVTFVIPDFSA